MDYSKLSKKQLIELVKKLESQQNNSTSFAKEKILSFSVSNVVQTNKASDNEQKIIQNLCKLVSHLRTENKELSQEKEDLLKESKELKIIINNIKVVGKNILIELKEVSKAAYETLTKRYDFKSIENLSNVKELEKLILQLLVDQWNAYVDILKYKNYTLNNSSEKSNAPAKDLSQDSNEDQSKSSNIQNKENINNEIDKEIEVDPFTVDDIQDKTQKELEKENLDSITKTGKQKYSNTEANDLPEFENLSKEDPLFVINNTASGINKNLNERDHQKEHLVLTDKKISTPNNDQGTIAGVISLNKDDIIYHYCPNCGKITRCKISTIKRDNVVSIIDSAKVKNILAPVYAITCQECKNTFDYNPTEFETITYTTDVRSELFKLLRNNDVKEESKQESHTETYAENSSLNADLTYCKNKEKIDNNINTHEGTYSSEDRESCRNGKRTIIGSAQVISAQTELEIRKYEKKITELEKILAKNNLDPKQNASIQAKIQYYDNKIRRLLADFLSSLPDAYERIGSITDSLVTTKEGNTIIDPYKFDSDLWGRMPLFLKSRISVGLAASMGAFFTNLSLPKSRISTFLNQLGSNYSRTQCITFINNFARAYIRPISRLIRKDILANCSSVLMDETPIKSKFKKTKNGNLGNYTMWTLVSSRTSPIKAVWFTCTPNRSKNTIVELFKDAKDTLKTLTVDMFSGYPAALKELEEAYGVKITLSSCLTHLRRPLHQYLSDNYLIKVYQDLITEAESFANFNKALTKRSKTQKDLSNNDIILLL